MLRLALLAVLATVPLAGSALAATDQARPDPEGKPGDDDVAALCLPRAAGEQCGPGFGRQTSGGGDKVSHKGWPAITGILWKVLDGGDHQKTGGVLNDELLGHHGDEVLDGGAGDDILWGDWDPSNNTTRQSDVLRGGPGKDFLYPSHGLGRVTGGPGNDYVWAYYGHGTIDCGPGYDIARVRLNGGWTTKNCEKIGHFCAFGPDGKGGCLKPGERRATAARRT